MSQHYFQLSNTTKCNNGMCTATITRTVEDDGKSNTSTKSFNFELPQNTKESFQYMDSKCPKCRGCSGCRKCFSGSCPNKCNCWGQGCWGCGNCTMCKRLPKCPRCRVQHLPSSNSMFCGKCRRLM